MKLGAEFQVNTQLGIFNSFSKENPAVAELSSGGFVITWDSDPQDGDRKGIYGQMFNADGTLNGGEFRVNTTTFRGQQNSSVTGLKDGGFVVSWESTNSTITGNAEIFAQRHHADGTKFGEEFALGDNNYILSDQGRYLKQPIITALDDGGFVAAWRAEDYNIVSNGGNLTLVLEKSHIRGQIYGADNVKKGAEFTIPTDGNNELVAPSITALKNAEFIVTYTSSTNGDIIGQMSGQRFNSLGEKVGNSFQPDAGIGYSNTSVTSLANGGFIFVFQHLNTSNGENDYNILGQLYAASGEKQGNSFLISQVGNSSQTFPNVVELNNGDIAVSYQGGDLTGTNNVIVVKILNANGVAKGEEFVVSDIRAMEQIAPDIAAFGEAGFIITWSAGLLFNGGQIILGRIWDENGTIGGVDAGSGSQDETGSAGEDIIRQLLGDVTLKGEAGNDKIMAFQGVNDIDGGADSDFLIGGIRSDLLNGGDGNDVIIGDASDLRGGADRIIGGKGDDGLMGGLAADTFVFNPNDGKDFIADFDTSSILKTGQSGYSVRYGNPFSFKDFNYRHADFEPGIDFIELNGFASVNANNVMDFISQGDDGAVFSAEGTEITFHDILIGQLTANDFLFI